MGSIAGRIGRVPADKVVFRNATGNTAALYKQAQVNYDKKQSDFIIAVKKTTDAKDRLDELRNYYKPFEQVISEQKKKMGSGYSSCEYNDGGVLNPAFDFILKKENFGFASWLAMPNLSLQELEAKNLPLYFKWIPGQDLRNPPAGMCISRLTADNWDYIYRSGGSTGEPHYRTAMLEVASIWLTALTNVDNVLRGNYDAAVAAQITAQKNVDDAKAALDKAIAAEEKASGQRIKEQMVSPEYLAAKAKADKILLDAQAQKRKSRNILILGLAGVALIGLLVATRKK